MSSGHPARAQGVEAAPLEKKRDASKSRSHDLIQRAGSSNITKFSLNLSI